MCGRTVRTRLVAVAWGLGLCVGAPSAEAQAPLDAIRELRLRGELAQAQQLAEHRLAASTDALEQVRLHLELARILDRVGLHTNTRPVEAALEHLEQAAPLLARGGAVAEAEHALARADYFYRAEMAVRAFPTAEAEARRAASLFRALEDRHGEAEAVHRLGLVFMQRRELAPAREAFERSLELDRAGGARRFFLGEYERHVGFVDIFSGDRAAALPRFERSLAARREAGAIDASLFAAVSLASALVEAGRAEEARPHLLYALVVAQRIDSPMGRMRAGQALGRVYQALGDMPAARLAYEMTLQVAESISHASTASAMRERLEALAQAKRDP